MATTRAILLTLILALCGFAAAQKTAQDMNKMELDMLAKLEKQYAAAKQAFEKKPKDAKAKKTYIVSANKFANATMVSPALPPRAKYPKALRVYREVKKVDPKNAEADKWIKEIERIYTSMGRPVPK
ncbi:MAG TPA: hypothetical protein VEX38_06900 [Fimbriimonadaceae bacterium]|nr:hypothetical protein [Fimbriimonadaceae bacterium]